MHMHKQSPTGKMNIGKQRQLLEDFFRSAAQLLRYYTTLDTGTDPNQSCSADMDEHSGCVYNDRLKGLPQIIVTLAQGQGGSVADGEQRRVWGNSWQVCNMSVYMYLHIMYI